MNSLKRFLRVFSPNDDRSADDWAAVETASMKVGDIYLFFKPARMFGPNDDMSELEIDGAALIFREDSGFPMNYYIDDESFEMSFMEGVLSSKAGDARNEGLAFYCLHSTLSAAASSESVAAIGGMNKWGGSGQRIKPPHGLADPLFFFLSSLGVELDQAASREPISVKDLVLSLWNTAALAPNSRAPRADLVFSGVDKDGVVSKVESEGHASLNSLLSDLSGGDSEDAPKSGNGGNTAESLPTGAPAAQGEDGKLSELLEKMASVQFEDDDPDDDENLDMASLENALKGLVSQQGPNDSPSVPDAKPNVGRRGALGPQFDDSDGAWEMLKAKPKPSGIPEPPVVPRRAADAPPLGASLTSFATQGEAQKSPGMEPWPEDFASALAAELRQEPMSGLLSEKTPKKGGMEAWPADFAAALKEGLMEDDAAATPPVPVSNASTASSNDDGMDFAATLASELNSEVNLSIGGNEEVEADMDAAAAFLRPTSSDPSAENMHEGAIADLLTGKAPNDSQTQAAPTPATPPPAKPESAQSRLEALMAKKSLTQTASKLIGSPKGAKPDAQVPGGAGSPLTSKIQPASTSGKANPFSRIEKPAAAAPVAAEIGNPAAMPSPDVLSEGVPAAAEASAGELLGNASAVGASAQEIATAISAESSANETLNMQSVNAETAIDHSVRIEADAVEAAMHADTESGTSDAAMEPLASAETGVSEATMEPLASAETGVSEATMEPLASAKTGVSEATMEPLASAETGVSEATMEPLASAETGVNEAAMEPLASAEAGVGEAAMEPLGSIEHGMSEVATEPTAEDTMDPLANAEASFENTSPDPSLSIEASPAAMLDFGVEESSVEAVMAQSSDAEAMHGESLFEQTPPVDAEGALVFGADQSLTAETSLTEAAHAVDVEPTESIDVLAGSAQEIAGNSVLSETLSAEVGAGNPFNLSAMPDIESAADNPFDVLALKPSDPASAASSNEPAEQAPPVVPSADTSTKGKLNARGRRAELSKSAVTQQFEHVGKTGFVSGKIRKDVEHSDQASEIIAAAVSLESEKQEVEPTESSNESVSSIEVAATEVAAAEVAATEVAATEVPASESIASAPVNEAEDEEDEDSASRPQKKLSLQATLSKLDDQSRRAFIRLADFKKRHEEVCESDSKSVKQRAADYESAVNESLSTVRQDVQVKLRSLFDEASLRLRSLVEDGEKQINERLPAAIADLNQIAAESDPAVIGKELQAAAESFVGASKERLTHVAESQDSMLNAVQAEELERLESWRKGQLKNFQDSFEQIQSRIEQHRISSLSALESCLHSLSEELKRLQQFDLERLDLLNSELSENLEQACRLAEMRLTRHCDIALAEQILPLLAEWKSKLGLRSHELRLQAQELLEGHSESSLADFEPVLSLGKESVTLIVSNVGELQERIEKTEKNALEKKLGALSKHFDKRLEELIDELRQQKEKESSGAVSQETESIQKVEKIGENNLANISETSGAAAAELAKQSETAVVAWESRARDICESAIAEMSADVEVVKNHRRDSVRRLQEKLNKVSTIVQALQAQLIQ